MNSSVIIQALSSELWGKKDISAIGQCVTSDVTIHSPMESTQGTEKLKLVIQQWLDAFPNLVVHSDDFICNETKIVSQWRAQEVHQGTFLDYPATNKEVHYSGVAIYLMAAGKVQEYWAYVIILSIIEQITITNAELEVGRLI